MTSETDIQYWERRAAEARIQADMSRDKAVREAHLCLAEHCADRAWGLRERD
jgi:hypothetical protein